MLGDCHESSALMLNSTTCSGCVCCTFEKLQNRSYLISNPPFDIITFVSRVALILLKVVSWAFELRFMNRKFLHATRHKLQMGNVFLQIHDSGITCSYKLKPLTISKSFRFNTSLKPSSLHYSFILLILYPSCNIISQGF